MPCRDRPAGRVVPDHARHRGDRRRVHVDEDHWDRRATEQYRSLGRRQRHHDEPVGSLGLGEGPQVVVALLDRLDVVDDEVELAVRQHGVDAPQPFSRLRPGQERNDDTDGQCPTEAQTPGGRARREAKLAHDSQDPIAGLGIDDVHPVQGPRGRRDADAGVAGDIADRDGLLCHDSSDVTGYMRPVSVPYQGRQVLGTGSTAAL